MIIKYTEFRWDLACLELSECEPDFDPQTVLDWLTSYGYVWHDEFQTGVIRSNLYWTYLRLRLPDHILSLMKLTFA